MDYFKDLQPGPADPILGINLKFAADTHPDKINVGVGAYRDENGNPWILPSIRAAEKQLYDDPSANHEYLPIQGYAPFIKVALNLAYGENSAVLKESRVVALQSLSGTGSLRLLASFFSRHMTSSPGKDLPTVYVSNPTWGNHYQIFQHSGFTVKSYRYWDAVNKKLDFEAMCQDLESFDDGSIIILHACSHNPTGVDPTLEQWAILSQICLQKKHVPLFDSAYQGFAQGDPEQDIASVRQFINDGHHIALAQSFAKNTGLYGERVGLCSIVTKDTAQRDLFMSNIKICARTLYSNPPAYGAKLIAIALGCPELKAQWFKDIRTMSHRMSEMRHLLRAKLIEHGSTLNWDHIVSQIGMFSFTGLTQEQAQRLMDEFHIYLTLDGRISIAGINPHNVDRLANAIHEVTKDQ